MEVIKKDMKVTDPIKEENEDENVETAEKKNSVAPLPSKSGSPTKKVEAGAAGIGNSLNALAALKKKGTNAGSPNKPSPPKKAGNKMMKALTQGLQQGVFQKKEQIENQQNDEKN